VDTVSSFGIGDLLTIAGVLVVIVVFVIAAYAGIVLIARTMHRTMPATTPPRDPALDALRVRLASGEIGEAEYERLRATLTRS
jgi:uncharacterized membrane protein